MNDSIRNAIRLSISVLVVCIAAAVSSFASTPSDELWLIAVGRGPGAAGSMWFTDLYVTNTSGEDVEASITLVERNGAVTVERRTIAAGATLSMPDVLRSLFAKETASGALRIAVEGEDHEDEFAPDRGRLAAHAMVFNETPQGTFAQSIEGLSDDESIDAEDGTVATAWIAGVRNDASYRTNWFGVNLSEDGDTPMPAQVLVELLGASGELVASKTYGLPAGAPVFFPLGDLAPVVHEGTLRFTMTDGEAFFGASIIDWRTNDPTTLEASRKSAADVQFTDEFFADDCTFRDNGENELFELAPGVRLVLEGEEDGEVIRHVIEVTNETRMVDGVRTRVVTETESADGELTEVSRNFFAECRETRSVFYFGEEVDIYEEGQIVSHEGAWLAGENGARAGIIMPGTILAGSRYFQEIAPGVALDRVEHLATGVTVETQAGDFEDCLAVRDTSALDPTAAGDVKIYCPGVGLVKDGPLELVSATVP
jgi:hypothetical protein